MFAIYEWYSPYYAHLFVPQYLLVRFFFQFCNIDVICLQKIGAFERFGGTNLG